MPDFDLGPDKYRQVSKSEMDRLGARLEHQPVLTQTAPIRLAILFCFFFGFWLFKTEALALIHWLIGLVWR